MTDHFKLICPSTLFILSLLTSPCQAVIWQNFGTYNANGVPNNLTDISAQLPLTLVSDVYKRLPESKNIKLNDPKLITDDLGANIQLLEDAEITVAFVNEGAGYNNSVGFFSYDPGNKPKAARDLNTKILFPNFSLPLLKFGDAVKLGKFKAGSGVGFSIVSNGWNGREVNPNQPSNTIFQTLKGLNPEPVSSANLNAHTVLLSKPEDGILILGFEDINRTFSSCDHDFNDVVIVIKVSPFSAVDRGQIQSLSKVVKDSDGDGVSDDLDAFPLDAERAARRFYPSATGYGNLAFEDNWPKKGDFDMNDLVVGYRAVETLNAKNEITDLKLIYQITARGAQNDNAFAVHLPGVLRSAIELATTTLTVASQAPVALVPETGQKEAVFIITPSANTLTKTNLAWPCGFFNTVTTCPRMAAVPMTAEIHFQTPLKPGQMASAPYNPFIYPNRYAGRGLEIHLVDHAPTDKADPKYFSTYDDTTNITQSRSYRTDDNKPWALDVPENWLYPGEWNNIANAYLSFSNWAAGVSDANTAKWYMNNINNGLVFKP